MLWTWLVCSETTTLPQFPHTSTSFQFTIMKLIWITITIQVILCYDYVNRNLGSKAGMKKWRQGRLEYDTVNELFLIRTNYVNINMTENWLINDSLMFHSQWEYADSFSCIRKQGKQKQNEKRWSEPYSSHHLSSQLSEDKVTFPEWKHDQLAGCNPQHIPMCLTITGMEKQLSWCWP